MSFPLTYGFKSYQVFCQLPLINTEGQVAYKKLKDEHALPWPILPYEFRRISNNK